MFLNSMCSFWLRGYRVVWSHNKRTRPSPSRFEIRQWFHSRFLMLTPLLLGFSMFQRVFILCPSRNRVSYSKWGRAANTVYGGHWTMPKLSDANCPTQPYLRSHMMTRKTNGSVYSKRPIPLLGICRASVILSVPVVGNLSENLYP